MTPLLTLYPAFQARGSDPGLGLEELPIQYADFAHWQRQWLPGPGVLRHQPLRLGIDGEEQAELLRQHPVLSVGGDLAGLRGVSLAAASRWPRRISTPPGAVGGGGQIQGLAAWWSSSSRRISIAARP